MNLAEPPPGTRKEQKVPVENPIICSAEVTTSELVVDKDSNDRRH